MKKYVRAEFTEEERQKYVDKVKREVENELDHYVVELDWSMEDENVVVTAEFADGSRVSFTYEPWRFIMNNYYIDSDVHIIVQSIKNYMRNNFIGAVDSDLNTELEWEIVKSKQVQDFDGFWTDYTLWYNVKNETWACFFGDSDLYNPETSSPDAEFDNYDEAIEWFDDYKGAEELEEDIESY